MLRSDLGRLDPICFPTPQTTFQTGFVAGTTAAVRPFVVTPLNTPDPLEQFHRHPTAILSPKRPASNGVPIF